MYAAQLSKNLLGEVLVVAREHPCGGEGTAPSIQRDMATSAPLSRPSEMADHSLAPALNLLAHQITRTLMISILERFE